MKSRILKVFLVIIFCSIKLNSQSQSVIKRLLVFDQAYPDYTILINQKAENDVVLVLPQAGNPVDLILESLRSASYDEINIYVLSKPNAIVFNALALTIKNGNEYIPNFEKWRIAIKPTTSLIIHSNSLDTDSEGLQLINSIREAIHGEVIVKP